MFLSSEAPIYTTGLNTLLVARTLNLVVVISLGLHYYLENRRRDRMVAETPVEVVDASMVVNEEFLDRTDKEDFMKFRYKW
jgi:MFS transporter, ACS family, allantoate permease